MCPRDEYICTKGSILNGWKNRDIRIVICWMMRALFVCGGFHHLKVKGRKAETKDAPVLALAPHSSFFDALPVVYLGGPSIVAKAETGRIPFFGSRSPTYALSRRAHESPFHLQTHLFFFLSLSLDTYIHTAHNKRINDTLFWHVCVSFD